MRHIHKGRWSPWRARAGSCQLHIHVWESPPKTKSYGGKGREGRGRATIVGKHRADHRECNAAGHMRARVTAAASAYSTGNTISHNASTDFLYSPSLYCYTERCL